MKVLTVRPPWAYYIIYGFWLASDDDDMVRYKNIENRTWKTSYRGRLAIHVSKQEDYGAPGKLRSFGLSHLRVAGYKYMSKGAIIGEVDLIDCVTQSQSLWFEGPFGFVLANPKQFLAPIPCSGRWGLWEIPVERMLIKVKEL